MASPSDLIRLLLFLIICFFCCILIIRILRFIYNLIRYIFLSFKYRPDLSHTKNKKDFKTAPKFSKNDFRMRDKKTEMQLYQEKVEKVNELKNTEEVEIVDIAKPIGKWTAFVTQQKMGWLQAMVGSKVESDQFWQNMIKAQQQASSKHKGQSR